MTLKLSGSAATFEPTRDPAMTGFITTRRFMSPSMRSGGGEIFVYDSSVVKDMVSLSWNPIDPTDLTDLITFCDAVSGSQCTFTLTDPAGNSCTGCRIFGPEELIWTPEDLMDRELTIEILKPV